MFRGGASLYSAFSAAAEASRSFVHSLVISTLSVQRTRNRISRNWITRIDASAKKPKLVTLTSSPHSKRSSTIPLHALFSSFGSKATLDPVNANKRSSFLTLPFKMLKN